MAEPSADAAIGYEEGPSGGLYERVLEEADAAGEDAAPPGIIDESHASAMLIDDFDAKTQRAVEAVGPEVVALAVGANRAYVLQWASGRNRPAPSVVRRVCLVSTVSDYLVKSLIATGVDVGDGPVVELQAWFTGRNPIMAEKSPAEIVRTLRFKKAAELVSAAALAFVD